MPLPFLLGIGAAVTGIIGAGSGIHGAVKMKEANDTIKAANWNHERNLRHFEQQSNITNNDMDKLGTIELNVLKGFEDFSDLIEKIQNRPKFKGYQKDGIEIPEYDGEKLKEVSVGAGVVLGGLGGAAVGTAGGFAAAGATTAVVMTLGTASTGTAISSLSGVALTNATLAALGGGSLATGGGGVALGSTMLGAATLGVGLLVGGVIFSVTGSSLSDKADEAFAQMVEAEKKINKICAYMEDLSKMAEKYVKSIETVNDMYKYHLTRLKYIIETEKKLDWNLFDDSEKKITENTVLLIGLLYNMCKVQLVLKSDEEEELNKINYIEVDKSMNDAKVLTSKIVS